jgi:enediyne biosynthesis protein E5
LLPLKKYQFLLMFSLLILGLEFRGFSVNLFQILLTFLFCNLSQYIWIKALRLEEKGYWSAFITSMGIALLLRSDSLWIHPLIGSLSISSKFLLRFGNRHLFNPAMIGIVLGISLFPGTWVSPGQWGQGISTTLVLLCFGLWVTIQAGMGLLSVSFLGSYILLLLFRIFYYEYQLDILWHQLENGSLLLFSFFMITDPKTCPISKIGQVIHPILVAVLAYHLQYSFYIQPATIWALFSLTPLLIFWNHKSFSTSI